MPKPPAGPCSVDGCETRRYGRGLCLAHYTRLVNYGDIRPNDPVQPSRRPRRLCAVEGCDRSHYCAGYCRPHYARWRRTGDVAADVPIGGRPRSCLVCGGSLAPGRATTCSEPCAAARRARGQAAAAAAGSGEPTDYVRTPGTGRQVTHRNIADFGLQWSAWEARLQAGTAPPHDGRLAGRRFWWQSTVEAAIADHPRGRGSLVAHPAASQQLADLLAAGWTGRQLAHHLGVLPRTIRAVAAGFPVRSLLIPRIQQLHDNAGLSH